LDALDWSAPRPDPPSDQPDLQSKSERALTVSEKVEQLNQIVERLAERIERHEKRKRTGSSDPFGPGSKAGSQLVERLQARIERLRAEREALLGTGVPAANSDPARDGSPADQPSQRQAL